MRFYNFVGAAEEIQEGIAVDTLLAGCGVESRDFYQTKFDYLSLHLRSVKMNNISLITST